MIGDRTSQELLSLHAEIADELRRRGILRSANNPVGDLAEHLFCRAFGWKPTTNSHPAADAIGDDGIRYQIKGRRLVTARTSRQVSALRDLKGGGFDFLAGVLFEPNYSIRRAAIIPHALVLMSARFYDHTNASLFYLRDQAWDWTDVKDVTEQLRSVTF